MKKFTCLLFSFLFILTGCTMQNTNDKSTQLDQEFKLKINEEAYLEKENIKVKFLDITGDSRCPSDANCAHNGEAVILINITKDNKDLGNFKLYTVSKNESDFDEYFIEFVDINPPRKTADEIEKSDYIATFIISKNSESNNNVSYGEKVKCEEGKVLEFPDFFVEYLYKTDDGIMPSMYFFEIYKGNSKKSITLSEAEELSPEYFEFNNQKYVLEIETSDIIDQVEDNELIIWKENDFEKK